MRERPGRRRVLLGLTALSFVGCSAMQEATPKPEVIGGSWVKPQSTETNLNRPMFTAEVRAIPLNNGPEIKEVWITANWLGATSPDLNDKKAWPILCKQGVRNDLAIFRCDIDLRKFNVPPGEITLSFDVYNVENERRLQPAGARKLNYLPNS